MKVADVLTKLKALGSESYRKILLKHGAKEPVLGVKISELKKLHKQIKTNHKLACELYETGIYDAQYLAGYVVDDQQMTKRDLQRWVSQSNSPTLCGTTVAWVAAEGPHGEAMALKWIDAKNENAAHTGWNTLSHLVALTDDADLDLALLKKLLKRVEKTIHNESDLVRYAMNGFVIAAGSYVAKLTKPAIETAKKIGTVTVDMGDTACTVPAAAEYIAKVQKRGSIGKKRKTVKC